jgi:hypothetical protein
MNRHGLADLNWREFSGVQLEVVGLDRANGTIKERLNSDARISDIAYERVGTQDDDISAFWVLADFGYFSFERGHIRIVSSQLWESEVPITPPVPWDGTDALSHDPGSHATREVIRYCVW